MKTATSATRGRLIGYARISTTGQDEQLQLDDLAKAGVARRDIYTDRGVSGSKTSRPRLDRMLEDIEPGDTLVIYKLDRLGRNSGHVITLLAELVERGIYVRSISDGLDTTTPTGRAMLGMLAIFAEMERGFIQDRTRAGLASAKAQGRVGGRPRALDGLAAKTAQAHYDKGEKVADIANLLKVSVPTVYRYLKASS
ncbi:recombinase family protein [Cryobacterium sp. M25]|uniref:recombinase family protein n=1 Tax=Cryobacterium sp. M25 TaxID=2048293 RepID=UPI000CE35C73|nr:recombinase family protein [Cryobacterium sp. M25]